MGEGTGTHVDCCSLQGISLRSVVSRSISCAKWELSPRHHSRPVADSPLEDDAWERKASAVQSLDLDVICSNGAQDDLCLVHQPVTGAEVAHHLIQPIFDQAESMRWTTRLFLRVEELEGEVRLQGTMLVEFNFFRAVPPLFPAVLVIDQLVENPVVDLTDRSVCWREDLPPRAVAGVSDVREGELERLREKQLGWLDLLNFHGWVASSLQEVRWGARVFGLCT